MRAQPRQHRLVPVAELADPQGYADDADYSARSWLIHKTHITRSAAVGHTAWARRTGTHPRVLKVLHSHGPPARAG